MLKDAKLQSESKNKPKNKLKRKEDSLETNSDTKIQDADGKPDWKKVKRERKDLKHIRKKKGASSNEVFELGVKSKSIWEEMRRDNCSDQRKSQLCQELYDLLKGKFQSFIYAHDTVRVIETLVSAGGERFRTLIYDEVKDDILKLIKNKYSKFFLLKLLRYGTRQQKDDIISAMKGHVVELMRHMIACDVVELAYNDYCNAKQRSSMIQEFYGPRFRYFKEDDVHSIDAALEKHPDLRQDILSNVHKALQPIIDKGVFTNSLIHTLMKEYLQVCGDTERTNIIECVREKLLPIVHTRDGSRVAMQCLWHGTPKDRKAILKSFKGHYVKLASEEYGHMVILTAFDCVDDTVFVCKAVMSEIMNGLSDITSNENGKKVLRFLVAPRSKVFFHPHVLKILEEGDKIGKFKKDRQLKYEALQKFAAKPILSLILENISSWIRDSQWTLFIGSALESLHDDSVAQVFDLLSEEFADPYIPGSKDHFLDFSYMVKMLSYIIACDKGRSLAGEPIFSQYLLDKASGSMRSWTLTNRGCFILVKLIETDVEAVAEKVLEICSRLKSTLEKSDFPGSRILLQKLNKK